MTSAKLLDSIGELRRYFRQWPLRSPIRRVAADAILTVETSTRGVSDPNYQVGRELLQNWYRRLRYLIRTIPVSRLTNDNSYLLRF